MTIFDTVTNLISALHNIERREHQIWTAQSPLIAEIRAEIAAAFGKASLECFTDALLANPGNSYLQLTHTCNPLNRFSMAIVDLRQDGDRVVAWKRAILGPVHLGEIDANTFRHAFTVYSSDEPQVPTWRARELTLPLNGAIAAHPLGARLISLANRLIEDDRVDQLEFFNTEMRALTLMRNQVNGRAEALPFIEYDHDLIGVLNEENADLASLIRTMDFTFEEADRVSVNSHNQFNAIRVGLNKLPLSDATTLYMLNARSYWSYALRYLVRHPALAVEVAA